MIANSYHKFVCMCVSCTNCGSCFLTARFTIQQSHKKRLHTVYSHCVWPWNGSSAHILFSVDYVLTGRGGIEGSTLTPRKTALSFVFCGLTSVGAQPSHWRMFYSTLMPSGGLLEVLQVNMGWGLIWDFLELLCGNITDLMFFDMIWVKLQVRLFYNQ